jgi:hypothetical protein
MVCSSIQNSLGAAHCRLARQTPELTLLAADLTVKTLAITGSMLGRSC